MNKETIIIEIRAAEGGRDSKDLVRKQLDIYKRYANKECL